MVWLEVCRIASEQVAALPGFDFSQTGEDAMQLMLDLMRVRDECGTLRERGNAAIGHQRAQKENYRNCREAVRNGFVHSAMDAPVTIVALVEGERGYL